jgi:putative hydrolase of the HAD superfamily
MVDVDGVVVRHPQGRRWDATLQADLGLSPDDLQQGFFARCFTEVILGRADLYEQLAPVLEQIAPHLTSAQLVDYWFAQDAWLDHALLADLTAFGKSGVELHLATVQEHHRARYLMETLGLSKTFGAIHYAADYGLSKPDPAFFRAVCARTGFAPHELLLIDDKASNVAAARACGWGGALWDGTQPLAAVLSAAGIAL